MMDNQTINRKKQYEDYVIVLEADCNPSWSIERFVKSLRLELHDIRSIPSNPKRFTACGPEKICKEIWKKYIKPTKINSRVTITRLNIQPLRSYQWFDKSAIDETTKRWRLEGTLELKLKNPLNIPDQDENANILEMLDALNENIITVKKAFDYYKSYDDEIGIINAKTALDKLQICKLDTGVPLTVFFDSTYAEDSKAISGGTSYAPKNINFNDFIRAFFRTKRLSGLETGLAPPKPMVGGSSSSGGSTDSVPLLPPIVSATTTTENTVLVDDSQSEDITNKENERKGGITAINSNMKHIDRDATSELNAIRRSRVERLDRTPALFSSMEGAAPINDTNTPTDTTSISDDLQMNTSVNNLNITTSNSIDTNKYDDRNHSRVESMDDDGDDIEDKDKIKEMIDRIQKRMVKSQVRWFENIELQQQQQGLPLSSLVHSQLHDEHKQSGYATSSPSPPSLGVSRAVRPLAPLALNGYRFQCPEAGTPSPYLRQSWNVLTAGSASISTSQEFQSSVAPMSNAEKFSLQQTLTEELQRLNVESTIGITVESKVQVNEPKAVEETIQKEGEIKNEGNTSILSSGDVAALNVDLHDVQKVLTQPQVQLMHLLQFWERVLLFDRALSLRGSTNPKPTLRGSTISTNHSDASDSTGVIKIENGEGAIEVGVNVMKISDSVEVSDSVEASNDSNIQMKRARRFIHKSFLLMDINSIYGTEISSYNDINLEKDINQSPHNQKSVDPVDHVDGDANANASTTTAMATATDDTTATASSTEMKIDDKNEENIQTAAIFVTDLPVLMSVLRLPASASWWLECYSHVKDILKKQARIVALKRKQKADQAATRDPDEVDTENLTPPSRLSAETIIDQTNTERLLSWSDFKEFLFTLSHEARLECQNLRSRLSESLFNTLTKVAKRKAKTFKNDEEARHIREAMIEEVKLREMDEDARLAFEADRIFMTAESDESKAIRRSMGIFSEILNPFKSKVKMTYEERYQPQVNNEEVEGAEEEAVETETNGNPNPTVKGSADKTTKSALQENKAGGTTDTTDGVGGTGAGTEADGTGADLEEAVAEEDVVGEGVSPSHLDTAPLDEAIEDDDKRGEEGKGSNETDIKSTKLSEDNAQQIQKQEEEEAPVDPVAAAMTAIDNAMAGDNNADPNPTNTTKTTTSATIDTKSKKDVNESPSTSNNHPNISPDSSPNSKAKANSGPRKSLMSSMKKIGVKTGSDFNATPTSSPVAKENERKEEPKEKTEQEVVSSSPNLSPSPNTKAKANSGPRKSLMNGMKKMGVKTSTDVASPTASPVVDPGNTVTSPSPSPSPNSKAKANSGPRKSLMSSMKKIGVKTSAETGNTVPTSASPAASPTAITTSTTDSPSSTGKIKANSGPRKNLMSSMKKIGVKTSTDSGHNNNTTMLDTSQSQDVIEEEENSPLVSGIATPTVMSPQPSKHKDTDISIDSIDHTTSSTESVTPSPKAKANSGPRKNLMGSMKKFMKK